MSLMVHRWPCRRCEFDVWSASEAAVANAAMDHLIDHHRNKLTKTDFRVQWECPYCDTTSQAYDTDDSIKTFKTHLFEHARPLVESGVHVADEINGVGDVLVLAPLESQGATNARIHFISPGDFVVLVTANPAARVRLLAEELQSWPAWTTIITTKQQPFAGLSDVDLDSAPMEVVMLDKQCSVADVGETISRVLDEQETNNAKVSVGFDILGDLLQLFDLETVFKFIHVLNARLENVDALTHYYLDPAEQPDSTVNMFRELFDIRITARDNVFVSRS